MDDAGFTWDLGGHVQFSHYETFDRYMDSALGAEGWLTHQRESWVWMGDRFVPYPFQSNIHRLDPEDRDRCLADLTAALASGPASPSSFGEWMLTTFGAGICDLFMRPYNMKVWAFPPEHLDWQWIGERVAAPSLERITESIRTNEDDVSWGPNAVFRFPTHGGTGAVWTAIGGRLPSERIHLDRRVVRVDPDARQVETADGTTYGYDHLVSTMPLDLLIRLTGLEGLQDTADALIHSSTHVVGVGLSGEPPEHLATKCWMYFPRANSPYYRVTVFSNYSPNNCPQPGSQWSLMAETAHSDAKPVDPGSIIDDTLRALREDGLLPDGTEILSTTHRLLEYGYPTPFLGRDEVLMPGLERLAQAGIYSRGRFGAWKYEVSNQDHSFAQGYECAERIMQGGGEELEPTLHRPAWVNARRNP